MMKVSVVVPIGPSEANKRWLDECVLSVSNQTWNRPDKGGVHLTVVDDMADASLHMIPSDLAYSVWKSPWYLGVAHAFNIGVAVSPTELVFMLGSDDWLEPECIEACVEEYNAKHGDPYAYFSVGVRYLDTGETQDLACHAAMVSKSLWRRTGGLPIQASTGASDAALLSIMLGNYPRAGRIWKVADGKPLYNYRRHNETDTASKGAWQGVILETRHLVTLEWKPRQDDPNE
jgi:glycosyltransferase involved in cell wall biosynthesis